MTKFLFLIFVLTLFVTCTKSKVDPLSESVLKTNLSGTNGKRWFLNTSFKDCNGDLVTKDTISFFPDGTYATKNQTSACSWKIEVVATADVYKEYLILNNAIKIPIKLLDNVLLVDSSDTGNWLSGKYIGVAVPIENWAIKDIDGNVYHTVTIGTQTWMLENLKVMRYRNGAPLTNVKDTTVWKSLKTEAYCEYLNSLSNAAGYGRLYNYYAATDSRNICPVGWHLPSTAEWNTLFTYLGGMSVAGDKMKETGTKYWVSPNTGATNSSGFTGLPAGYNRLGVVGGLGVKTYYWSSTQTVGTTTSAVDAFILLDNYSPVYTNSGGYEKSAGFSIRCIKD